MKNFDITRLVNHDFSAGTERFEEDLLQRALSVLGQDTVGGIDLSDDDLDMFAAAGVDPTTNPFFDDKDLL